MEYAKVYQLMLELSSINKMPDSIKKAIKFRDWTIKAVDISQNISPPKTHMKLVQ